jgi:tRNA pseudouridine-54 N-methylase
VTGYLEKQKNDAEKLIQILVLKSDSYVLLHAERYAVLTMQRFVTKTKQTRIVLGYLEIKKDDVEKLIKILVKKSNSYVLLHAGTYANNKSL